MQKSSEHHTMFFGWWIIVACFVITFYISGVVFFGFTAVFRPIANEFGWSYTQISFAASLRGLEMGLLAPLVGLVVDRWGPRRLLFGGTILIGLGLVLLSRTSSLGMFYGAFVLIAIGMSASSGTVLLTAVVNWFQKNVALATGIVASGFALGGLLVPLVTVLIDMFDWRTAMVILGLGVWVIAVPLSLVVRHKPEQYGYLPDGVDESLTSTRTNNVDMQVRGATTRSVFWRIALTTMIHMLTMSAVVTHVMPYLTSTGITRSSSSLIASAIPVASIGGRLGFGWLGDRFDKRRLAATGFLLIALGLLFFGYLGRGSMWLLVPFLIIFSTGWGNSVTMRAALLREYFSRSRFGMTYGFVMGIGALGNIAGAPLAGWVFDRWGTYRGIWFALAGLAVIGIIAMLTMPLSHNRIQLANKHGV